MTDWIEVNTLWEAIKKLEEGCYVRWNYLEGSFQDKELVDLEGNLNIELSSYLKGEFVFRYKPKEVKPLTLKFITDRWWRKKSWAINSYSQVQEIVVDGGSVCIDDGEVLIKELSDPTKWEGKTIEELDEMRNNE